MKRCSSCEETTIIHQIFETNSSFHVKQRENGKNSISVAQEIFTRTDKILISGGGRALGNNEVLIFLIYFFFRVNFFSFSICTWNTVQSKYEYSYMLIYIHVHIKVCKYLFNGMKWIKKKKKPTIPPNLYPTLPFSLGSYKVDFFVCLRLSSKVLYFLFCAITF